MVLVQTNHSEVIYLLNRPPSTNSKSGTEKKFWTKIGQNGLSRNFYSPKTYVFGAGALKFFLWTAKRFQSPRGRFLMLLNSFWDCVGPPESKNAKIRPQNAFLQKFLHPQNRPFWGGVVENFSARTKRGPKSSEKLFRHFKSILGLYRSARAENR